MSGPRDDRGAWVAVYEKLMSGRKRGLPRATRFVYLEIVMKARPFGGSLPLPPNFKTDVDAVHDIVGGNRREVDQALQLLTVAVPGDQPMLRLEGDAEQRFLVVVSFAKWCRGDHSTERVRKFREKQRETFPTPAAERNVSSAVPETERNVLEKKREEQKREEPPTPTTSSKKSRGRKPASFMTADWALSDDLRAKTRAAGLDPDLLRQDFVDYWLAQGKSMADWDATFRSRIRQVIATDWARQKFALVERVAPAPKEQHGPPAPVPPELLQRMRNFASGTRARLTAAEPPSAPSTADDPESKSSPSLSRQPNAPEPPPGS